jgi:hypothetical protein
MALAGVVVTLLVLAPGLFLPVLTVRGSLNPEGVAELAPRLLEEGITDSTVSALRPLLNPTLLPFIEMAPGGLKAMVVTTLGGTVANRLRTGQRIDVYAQTRSIVGSVQHLYKVGSGMAATLILLFSVIVPLTKSLLVSWAVLQKNLALRRRTLFLVETIAKWSMADVFAVAIIIAWLAAQASQTVPGPNVAPPVVVFDASFGPGFWWFSAYCVTSLALQQFTARWLMRPQEAESP